MIYEGALAPESAMALYRQWQPVTFSNGQWSFPVPAGLEGYYQIDMRASDAAGNRSDDRGDWPQFRGPIDTQFPTFDLNVTYSGSGSAAQTTFTASVRDANLTSNDYSFICPLTDDQRRYNLDATQLVFAGASDQLMGIDASCTQSGFQNSLVAARACDEFGHCGSASHAGITAAPTLAALPGIPYLYASDHTNMLRIPLQGNDHTPEPVLLDNNGLGGVAIASDLVRNKLILNNFSNGEIATVNPNGTGYSVIADASVDNLIHDHRLAVAVDEAAGRLYWTQINSFYLSSIKSAKLDGSDVQTIVPQILNQRGLTLDALRKKLLWVATDRTERENIIFRSTIAPAALNGTAWTRSFVFTQTGIYQIVVVATDLAGNKTPLVIGEITALYTELPVLRPVITAAITGTLANNGWYTSTVAVSFTCAGVPGGLGLATNTVTGTILTADGADQAVTNSGVCIDNGNNAAISVTVSNIDIDKTPPVVAVTGVSNGATYAPGSVPTAGCSTNDATAGDATSATVAITGGNGDGTGSFTATCSGVSDNAGNNTAPVSVAYTVTVPAQATITIVLDARPKATTNFAFIGSLGRFILDDPATDDGDANPSSKSFTVAPGTYTVNRNSALNWFVTAIACTPEGKVVTDLAQRSAAITVAGNDAVTCTFTLERGSIIRARAFHDLIRKNANLGKRNAGDPWLGGWTMTVFTAPTATVASSVTVPVGNLFGDHHSGGARPALWAAL